jgi:hypothetical protein
MCLPIQPERLYKQIVSQIEQRNLAGELKASDQLPSEHELAKQFAVRWKPYEKPLKRCAKNVWQEFGPAMDCSLSTESWMPCTIHCDA